MSFIMKKSAYNVLNITHTKNYTSCILRASVLFLLSKFRKEMSLINYFFEIVMPQLLEYFKENAKDVPYSLLSEVLINNKNYEKK